MVTTRVTWEYSNATQEEKDATLAFEQTLPSVEVDAAPRSILHGELQQKVGELSGEVVKDSAILEIEKDEAAELVRHHWTRTWPDLAAAQQWIDFVLSKGAKSAVIVE